MNKQTGRTLECLPKLDEARPERKGDGLHSDKVRDEGVNYRRVCGTCGGVGYVTTPLGDAVLTFVQRHLSIEAGWDSRLGFVRVKDQSHD
jgi:hypothetical protein